MAETSDNQVVTHPGPGVHVVVHPEPLRAARAVAEAVGAQLIDLPEMAESAIAQRHRLPEARAAVAVLEAIEQQAAAIGGDPDIDRSLLARRREFSGLARRRILDDATADRLLAMAGELRRLESALAATEDQLQRAFADALDLAPPPERPSADGALAAAAAAVMGEEAAVDDARHSLALLDPSQGFDLAPPAEPEAGDGLVPDPGDDPTGEQAHEEPPHHPDRPANTATDPTDATDAAPAPTHDGSVLMPLGIFLLGVFVAALVLLTGLTPIAALVALVIAGVAASVSRYSIKSEIGSPGPPPVVTIHLGAPAGANPTASRMVDERTRRARAVRDAEVRLAAARRTWASIAGTEADPYAVEDFVRQSAPASPTVDLLAAAPEVRALTAVHRTVRADWRVLWAELGRTAPPPDQAVVDLLLADLRETAPDPREADAMLLEIEAAADREDRREAFAEVIGGAELEDLRRDAPGAEDLDDAPLVLVSPFSGLGSRRRTELRRHLDELEGDLTVVLVVETAEEVPRPAVEG